MMITRMILVYKDTNERSPVDNQTDSKLAPKVSNCSLRLVTYYVVDPLEPKVNPPALA